ncbi:MAG: DUF507 family protein [Proteobacteria bacterium]|nr:DUF507 family protein [Pseudomonadota bacterium]
MNYSEDRLRHIAHLILDDLKKNRAVEVTDNSAVLNDLKRMLFGHFKMEDEIDEFVRRKIRSYSRMIAEGSREWDIMYDKLFEEEKAKRG